MQNSLGVSFRFEEIALEHEISKVLELDQATLNLIDFDDVLVAESVVASVSEKATKIMRSTVPATSVPSRELVDFVTGFDDRAYWVEETRTLIISMDIFGKRHFFTIPPEEWETRPVVTH